MAESLIGEDLCALRRSRSENEGRDNGGGVSGPDLMKAPLGLLRFGQNALAGM